MASIVLRNQSSFDGNTLEGNDFNRWNPKLSHVYCLGLIAWTRF